MKSRLLVCFTGLLLHAFCVCAQTVAPEELSTWFFSVHSGALLGKKGHGSSLTASMVQGVRLKRLSIGVGVGYDAYEEWRTLPVFASVGYDFIRRPSSAFFVGIDPGYSRAWNPIGQDERYSYVDEGGFFFHPKIGYRTCAGKLTMHFSAGYKFQRLQYGQTDQWWVWGFPGSAVTVQRDMERLSIQMGFGVH